MAPITATTAGVARQIIDDPELTSLLSRLCGFTVPTGDVAREMEEMVDGLVGELEGVQRWRFQEQVRFFWCDVCVWIL